MGTTASLLTVPSSSPARDVDHLQKIFPANQFRVEEEEESENGGDGGNNKILVGDGKTVFLLCCSDGKGDDRSLTLTTTTITWAVDESQLQSVAGHELVQSVDVAGSSVNEIELPGGSTLLMVPFAIAASVEGRRALLRRLSSRATNERTGTTTTLASTPSRLSDAQDGNIYSSSEEPVMSYSEMADLPRFPSLQFKLLKEVGKRSNFEILLVNTREAIDVETDLFKGKMLLLIRPTNPLEDDPYWNERLWSKKKRRLQLQVQGKFSREPRGTIYAGAEVSEEMKLGLVTRGLCKVLLGLVESFTKSIHYSFGEKDELAHIVAPAHSFFDRMVVTPPDQTPPPIDAPFEESAESIARRKKLKSYGKWGTTDTYSFSFYSMYIDLPSWQLVGLPASGDLSLKTFWGKSLLRLCMYEKLGESKRHSQEDILYAFSVQVKHLSAHERTKQSLDSDVESLSDEDEGNIISWSEKRRSSFSPPSTNSIQRSESQFFPEPSDNVDDMLQFFDAEDGTESGLAPEAIGVIQEADEEASSSGSLIPAEILSAIDYVCPARVDLFSGSKSYTKAFAVNVESTTVFRSVQDCEDLVNQSVGNRVEKIIKARFSPRLSSSERLRRSVGLILSRNSEYTGVPSSAVRSFEMSELQQGSMFLSRPKPVLTERELTVRRISGFVARALSDRHWVEHFVIVNGRTISFYPPADKSKAQYRISLSDVSKAERLAADLCPQFFGHHVLALTTLGRTVYLMFASTSIIDKWIEVIDSLKAPRLDESDSFSSWSDSVGTVPKAPEFRGLTDEFLHKSSIWQCKNRRILNCAKFVFRNDSRALNPLALAEDALEKTLTSPTVEGTDDINEGRAFLESAAELKRADVQDLDEKSRLAFFLNVYHIMISHAFLVLGPPDSSLKWLSYFNSQAYQVGDDIFSITELEHCIIRANMASPTQFFSRFVIPKTRYQIALKTGDFRINFALNCGSLSSPSKVLIYRPEELNEQLDVAARLYLNTSVIFRRTGAGDLEIKLPKICQWFAEDFGPTRQHLLKVLEPFFADDLRTQLKNCWLPEEQEYDMSCCEIRYHPYSFECRPLLTLRQ